MWSVECKQRFRQPEILRAGWHALCTGCWMRCHAAAIHPICVCRPYHVMPKSSASMTRVSSRVAAASLQSIHGRPAPLLGACRYGLREAYLVASSAKSGSRLAYLLRGCIPRTVSWRSNLSASSGAGFCLRTLVGEERQCIFAWGVIARPDILQ